MSIKLSVLDDTIIKEVTTTEELNLKDFLLQIEMEKNNLETEKKHINFLITKRLPEVNLKIIELNKQLEQLNIKPEDVKGIIDGSISIK
jgi:hypothetical protein